MSLAHDNAARGEVLGIVGDRPNVLVARRKIDAHEAIGVSDWAFLPQLIPDGIRIFDPRRIEVIEITGPIGNGRTCTHGSIHSSMMSMAISGQLAAASRALSSRPVGTVPSPIARALPSSSSAKSSDAIAAQRAWPWQRDRSTRTLIAPAPASCRDRRLMAFAPPSPRRDRRV